MTPIRYLYLEDELLDVLRQRYRERQYLVSERHACAFIEIDDMLDKVQQAVANARVIGAEDERIGG